MALLKNITCDFDLVASYWAIDEVNIHWTDQSAHAVLMGYRSEEAKKDLNEKPVKSYSYDFNSVDFPFTKGGNNEEEFYTWFKAKIEETQGSTDPMDSKYTDFVGYNEDL